MIFTSIINICSECNDMNNALKVFNSIPCHTIDIIVIGTMMKCFVNNNQNEHAIINIIITQ